MHLVTENTLEVLRGLADAVAQRRERLARTYVEGRSRAGGGMQTSGLNNRRGAGAGFSIRCLLFSGKAKCSAHIKITPDSAPAGMEPAALEPR